MPAVRARRPGARLRMVGSAPPREVLDLAGPGIEVIADAPSMQPHLEAAGAGDAPVRSGGGMRMKVLEAMAAGKAVVTTASARRASPASSPTRRWRSPTAAEEIAAATPALLGDAGDAPRPRPAGAASSPSATTRPQAWAAASRPSTRRPGRRPGRMTDWRKR